MSHSAEKFRRGTFVLLQKFPLAKKFMDKTGRGVSIFSVEFFCLTVPKNFAAEPFCAVFQEFPVAKTFMDKRGGGRESQDNPSKIFCLTVPKISVGGNPLVFQ